MRYASEFSADGLRASGSPRALKFPENLPNLNSPQAPIVIRVHFGSAIAQAEAFVHDQAMETEVTRRVEAEGTHRVQGVGFQSFRCPSPMRVMV